MLQNRVDPFGRIIMTDARGAFMGNRGVIHNEDKQITHAFKHKQWIICTLQFKGRRRSVMTPGRWTELFFLDEATAFAAGHRPCFECRKEDATRFKSCWIQGNPSYNFTMKTSIKDIDQVLHRERIDSDKKKVTHQSLPSELPDGTFVSIDEHPCLLNQGRLHRWTPFGYDNSFVLPETEILTVLTPHSVVNAFSAGYRPQLNKPFSGHSSFIIE
jgi:hypothetical protein